MVGLSRSSVRLLVVGVVAIVVISVGAATIAASVEFGGVTPSGDSNQGGINPSGGENISTNGSAANTDDPEGNAYNFDITTCVQPLATMPGTIAYFLGFGGLMYGIQRRYSFGSAMMAAFGLAPLVVTGFFLGTDCSSGGASGGDGPGFFDGAGDVIAMPDIPPAVMLGVLGLLLVGAAAVVIRATGDQFEELEQDEEAEDEPDVSDLAEAAGAAADRLEKHSADVDNAVYRAWWEMTNLLDVPNPDSATPGEFAAAAVDVGMNESHVSELTTLFEEVRYGQRDPDEREDHAIEVFRDIESEYGEDIEVSLDPDDGSDGGSR